MENGWIIKKLIKIHCDFNGFNGIGDQVPRLKRKGHALGPHAYAVADADGIKSHAN